MWSNGQEENKENIDPSEIWYKKPPPFPPMDLFGSRDGLAAAAEDEETRFCSSPVVLMDLNAPAQLQMRQGRTFCNSIVHP